MAGSIVNNIAARSYKYIAPTPPSNLIDSTTFTIDFAARKFISVGLDPADQFNVVAHIITPSRYVSLPVDFMRRIFSLMGNILSFILEKPAKYKRNIYLETDCTRVSSMVYRGENVLVIEETNQDGCRVLLNRADLITLQYLEWAIFELMVRKSSFVRPTVMQQFNEMCDYFKNNFKRVENVEEMAITIKNIHDDLISSHISKNSWNFVSQLKLFATTQLAEQCIMKIEPEVNKKKNKHNYIFLHNYYKYYYNF
jgi:hypothetical protein